MAAISRQRVLLLGIAVGLPLGGVLKELIETESRAASDPVDLALRDAAIADLKQTNVGWNKARNYSPSRLAGDAWGRALEHLSQIGTGLPPSGPAVYPSLTLYPSETRP